MIDPPYAKTCPRPSSYVDQRPFSTNCVVARFLHGTVEWFSRVGNVDPDSVIMSYVDSSWIISQLVAEGRLLILELLTWP
jgi:hypothetical protein